MLIFSRFDLNNKFLCLLCRVWSLHKRRPVQFFCRLLFLFFISTTQSPAILTNAFTLACRSLSPAVCLYFTLCIITRSRDDQRSRKHILNCCFTNNFFLRSDVDYSSFDHHHFLVLNNSWNGRLDRADAGGDRSDRRATPRDPLSDSEGLRTASTTGRRRCNKRTNYKFVSSPQFDVVMIIITIVVVRNGESDRSTSVVVVVVVATKRCDPIQATVYDKNWWRDKGALRRVVSIERKASHKKNRVWIHIIQ